MTELGYKPKNILAQNAGFSDKSLYDAVGKQIDGAMTRSSFSPDLAAKRPLVGKVNDMFKARAGKDLTDLTSREFMAVIVMADAIDRAKSTDGNKIREALRATNIPGERTIMPWRSVRFDETGPKPRGRPRAAAMAEREVRDGPPTVRRGGRSQDADEPHVRPRFPKLALPLSLADIHEELTFRGARRRVNDDQ
jgi:ABC-type branched-subunit amino acid transport system substrate-binding protein